MFQCFARGWHSWCFMHKTAPKSGRINKAALKNLRRSGSETEKDSSRFMKNYSAQFAIFFPRCCLLAPASSGWGKFMKKNSCSSKYLKFYFSLLHTLRTREIHKRPLDNNWNNNNNKISLHSPPGPEVPACMIGHFVYKAELEWTKVFFYGIKLKHERRTNDGECENFSAISD